MPSPFRMPPYTRGSSAGPSWPRRLGALIRAVLLVSVVLCAVAHGRGADEEPHGPMTPVGAVAQVMPGEADEHGPHPPHPRHGAESCADEAVVRTAPQSPESPGQQPSPGADTPAPLLAGAAVLARLWAAPGARRRRPARTTGRTRLARTARLRL
ncbi:hypothetical protein [Streptomyces sp. bgisy032]|uniref:hypothetical protein n=1 Tax=Streptomyces sp. bgisy032 TaxID=3413773 RepID=UPI003D75FDEA